MDTPNSSTSQRAIATELAKMFALFPQMDQSPDAQKLRLAGYLDAIGDFPVEAVQLARVRVCRGLVPHLNRSFAPSPAEFSEIVRGIQYRPVPAPRRLEPEAPPSRSEQERAEHVRQAMAQPVVSRLPKASALPPGTIVKWDQVDRFPTRQRS